MHAPLPVPADADKFIMPLGVVEDDLGVYLAIGRV
jgi:hypothetical protein